MSLNFPDAPSIGQIYPPTPVDGISTYTWDGEKWTVRHNAPPSNSLPLMDGAADGGISDAYSREDHVHPTDSSRAAASAVLMKTGGQTITGGFLFTPAPLAAGNITINALLGNYQYIANNGPFTINSATSDCAIDLMVTNSGTAGAITFSGFTIGTNTGDLLTTANGDRFIISFRRINAISTYVVKALQ
jgi:hypothetical protein